MQCAAEKTCSLCVWGQNPLLASKHLTVGFPRLFVSGAILVCFAMWVENRKYILESVNSPGPECAVIRSLKLAC